MIAQGLSRKSILDKVDLTSFQSSTKIEALMEVTNCCSARLYSVTSCFRWDYDLLHVKTSDYQTHTAYRPSSHSSFHLF